MQSYTVVDDEGDPVTVVATEEGPIQLHSQIGAPGVRGDMFYTELDPIQALELGSYLVHYAMQALKP